MQGTHSPGFRYLPDESEVNSIGSWTYSFDMGLYESQNALDLGTATVSGSFVEIGTTQVTVDGQTVDAYRLTNTYEFNYPGFELIPTQPQGAFIRSGYVEQVWIAGVGLYSEVHSASYDDGTPYETSKQLDSFTGLTPIQ
jgi:hypothetical protein